MTTTKPFAAGSPLVRPAWQKRAMCRRMHIPVDEFYPKDGRPSELARAACAVCPVAEECLAMAIEHQGEAFDGMHGGRYLTGVEKQKIGGTKAQAMGRAKYGAPIEHGTDRGYYTHLRRKESACDECKAAHSLREQERKAERKRDRDRGVEARGGVPALSAFGGHARDAGEFVDGRLWETHTLEEAATA